MRIENLISKPAVSPAKAVRQRWIRRPSRLLVGIASLMLPIEEHDPWLSSELFGACPLLVVIDPISSDVSLNDGTWMPAVPLAIPCAPTLG